MEETPISDSVKKRLALQNERNIEILSGTSFNSDVQGHPTCNLMQGKMTQHTAEAINALCFFTEPEVLKWLNEFSEKMHTRAENIANELNGLLDQTGIVEVDMKNTLNTFHGLFHDGLIDHKISDENNVQHVDCAKSSNQTSIPAQDYEKDILPRYKEALSSGLSSCKKHLQNTERFHFSSSFSRMGLVRGSLPHIIGSEEYTHDDSCGLAEELASRSPQVTFRCMRGSRGAPSSVEDHGSSDLFGGKTFDPQEESIEKDGTEPLTSAALDFKSMLEAALLSPYKFYDETLPGKDVISEDWVAQRHNNLEKTKALEEPVAVSIGRLQDLSITEQKSAPDLRNDLSFLRGADITTDEIYSGLIGGSLFDPEEDLLSSDKKETSSIHSSEESSSKHDGGQHAGM